MPILSLSHSGSDTEVARALKRRIEDSPAAKEAGLKVWFDKDDLREKLAGAARGNNRKGGQCFCGHSWRQKRRELGRGRSRSRAVARDNISQIPFSAYALRCDLDRRQTETLLIIDQFEELLIQTPEEKRAPFADFLCALADGPFGFRILLTLRADYFNLDDSLQQLRSRLWADWQDAVFRLRRMSDKALAETAREPLALAGFKDQAAVEALIQAIQRDVSDREGEGSIFDIACAWLPDYDLSGLGKDYGLDLSQEAPSQL